MSDDSENPSPVRPTRREFLKTGAAVGTVAATGDFSKLADAVAPAVVEAIEEAAPEIVKLSRPAALALHKAESARMKIFHSNLKKPLEDLFIKAQNQNLSGNLEDQLANILKSHLQSYKAEVDEYARIMPAIETYYDEIADVVRWVKGQEKLVKCQNANEQLQLIIGGLQAWLDDPKISDEEKDASVKRTRLDNLLVLLQEKHDDRQYDKEGKEIFPPLREILKQPLSIKDKVDLSIYLNIKDCLNSLEKLLGNTGSWPTILEEIKTLQEEKLPVAITQLWKNAGFANSRDGFDLRVSSRTGEDIHPNGRQTYHVLYLRNTPDYVRETFDVRVRSLPRHVSTVLKWFAPEFGHLPEYQQVATAFSKLLRDGLPEIVEAIKPGTMEKIYKEQRAKETYEAGAYEKPEPKDGWTKAHTDKKRSQLDRLMSPHIKQRFENGR